MLDILKSILFGIIEGITEWLPISSTGHMIILESLLDVKDSYGQAFWDFFLVAIQLGAIIAVIICFFNKLWPFGKSKDVEVKKNTWLIWTLIIYGVFFIVIEIFNKKRSFKINDIKDMSISTALIIGFIQLLSLIPGTSRSGVTILGAMLIGCNRTVSAEFSFFLSIPVMLGASLLKGVKFFMDNSITTDQIVFLLVGMVVAFVVSMLVIKFLMRYIKKHDFKVFGVYRIVLGIILIILFATSVISV